MTALDEELKLSEISLVEVIMNKANTRTLKQSSGFSGDLLSVSSVQAVSLVSNELFDQ